MYLILFVVRSTSYMYVCLEYSSDIHAHKRTHEQTRIKTGLLDFMDLQRISIQVIQKLKKILYSIHFSMSNHDIDDEFIYLYIIIKHS